MKKFLVILALVAFASLTTVKGNNPAPFDRYIKVFTYWQTCNCYMLTFDDLANDGCEWFVNGEDVWDNGHCH